MRQLTEFKESAKQRCQIITESGDIVDFRLYFYPTQNAWYFDFKYKDIEANGLRVVLSPNTLRNFRKIIPFGLSFMANDEIDPFKLDDFSSGRVSIYLLSQDDVDEIERTIYLS